MTPEWTQYREQGFFIARALLPVEECALVVASLEKTVTDQVRQFDPGYRGTGLFDALHTLFRADIARYKRVVGALWRKHDVLQLLQRTEITKFLAERFGQHDLFQPGGQVVHIMAEELRIQNGYFGLLPHQDFPSVQGSLDGVVIWAPLVDVDADNFPLEVLPRHHLRGVAPMVEGGASTWEIRPDWYDEADFVKVPMAAGDVLFMSMFTPHRSCTNGTPGRFRLAVSTRYDNGDEPTYIERAYPTAYVRTVHRKQYFENFPDVAQVKALFVLADRTSP